MFCHCHNRSTFSVRYGITSANQIRHKFNVRGNFPTDVIIIVILVKYSMYRKVFNAQSLSSTGIPLRSIYLEIDFRFGEQDVIIDNIGISTRKRAISSCKRPSDETGPCKTYREREKKQTLNPKHLAMQLALRTSSELLRMGKILHRGETYMISVLQYQ